jgi:hypothetical protein
LDLSDKLWATSAAMESFPHDLENIIVALQLNRSLETISISGEILAAIEESDKSRLYCSLANLPTLQRMAVYRGAESYTAIHTRALADALSETSNGLKSLVLSGFKISSQSEVEQLARGLKARVGTLTSLTLEDIEVDVQDRTGFLDPILLALAFEPDETRGQLSYFKLSCVEAASNRTSVVSPEALGAFFVEEPLGMLRGNFFLNNLGLNDNHCKVMAQELVRVDVFLRPIKMLGLTGNPSIGQLGYEALLGLLNRRFDIGAVVVNDQSWESTFNLVILMNVRYRRGHFLENGVFASKAMWVDFLAELASFRHFGWSEAQKLNAIWYTLREDPDLICT